MATRYIKHIDGRNQPVVEYFNVAASQTINAGDLVQVNATSRKIEAAVAASTTLIGVAHKSITTGASVTSSDNIPVVLLKNAVFRTTYVGTTKTTLVETDLYTTKFDLSDKTAINLDDTLGGMASVLNYDNTKKTADVVFATANLAF